MSGNIWNPAADLAYGLQFGRNFRRQEADQAWQDQLRAEHTTDRAVAENDRARLDQEREFRQFHQLARSFMYDGDGNYIGDAGLNSPTARTALSDFVKGSTYVKRDVEAGANAALSKDEVAANGYRKYAGLWNHPQDPNKYTYIFQRDRSTGPQTEGGAVGPDARVVLHDGNGFADVVRNTLAMYSPELADSLRAEAKANRLRNTQADLAGYVIDQEAGRGVDNGRAIAENQASIDRWSSELSQLPPASTAPASSPQVGATIPQDQQARVVASLEAGLQDYLKKIPGAAKFPVGTSHRDTYDQMVRNLESAKNGMAPTRPTAVDAQQPAPAENPKAAELRSNIQSATAINARLKAAERSGKIDSGTRDRLVTAVREGAIDIGTLRELVKRPELKTVADAGNRLIALDGQGNVIGEYAVGEKPMTEKDRAAGAAAADSANLDRQKFIDKWINDRGDNYFHPEKQRHENTWIKQAMGITMRELKGYDPTQNVADATAMTNIAVRAIERDKDGFAWFNKEYSDYPSLTIPLLAVGLSEGDPDIRGVVDDLTPKADLLAKAEARGISKQRLVTTMANDAQKLVGQGVPAKQAILQVRQQAEQFLSGQ